MNDETAPAESTRRSSDDRFAEQLRGFGPVGLLAILAILVSGNVSLGYLVLPLGGVFALLWVRLSQTPWREIGYVRPRSWIGALVFGVVLGVALKLLTKTIVLPLLGGDTINHTYHYLVGNGAMLPWAAWMMLIAGFGEETVFRGFLFERLGKLLGSSVGAKISIVLITTLLFASFHYPDQGLSGVEQALVTGLAFGSVFAVTGRIFTVMCAHAAYDLTALAIIYLNLETTTAHLIFK
jgi:membrane protease YdiL (CAAX protease family)